MPFSLKFLSLIKHGTVPTGTVKQPLVSSLKPVFHWANLFARTDKKVGTLPTCSRRIFSPANFNQSRCRILVFASRRANKFAWWKTGFKDVRSDSLAAT